MIRHRSIKPDDAIVRRRLHELAKARPSFGAKRLHVLLRRDGLAINHKKAHRLNVEEGLQLKPRRRRRRSAVVRQRRAATTGPNERWPMDFMHDVLATKQTVRLFTLVDVHTRECLALEATRSFAGPTWPQLLGEAGDRGGTLPSSERNKIFVARRVGLEFQSEPDGALGLSICNHGETFVIRRRRRTSMNTTDERD